VPDYTLNINLTKQQVDLFHTTGQNVIVAKPTQGGSSNVAWQVIRPLEGNHVKWDEQYGIYASTAQIENGAELTQMSQTPYPSMEGKTYPFSSQGTFGVPTGSGAKGTFYSSNSYENKQGYLTFGLFQAAVVNGETKEGNAISAAPVLQGQDVEMTPYTTLFVWLQSQVFSNTVVTNVTTPKTEVVFGGATPEMSLAYDDAGHFVPEALELPEGAAVNTHIPTLL